MIIRILKSICNHHLSKPLRTYKTKEFDKILNEYGYYYDHTNGSHRIFIDNKRHYIVVPYSGKEVNAMMSTIILQRIKRGLCKTY